MELNELFHLGNKTAIVTGGGRGLGEQMANALGEAGANVVIRSRRIEACEHVRKNLEAKGVKALAIECDITKEEDIQKVIQKPWRHLEASISSLIIAVHPGLHLFWICLLINGTKSWM